MAPVEVLAQVSERSPAVPAVRSVRRATARRASARRAFARSRHRDDEASIIAFLADHPDSSVGDLAKRLDLDPEHVATCLTQLTSTGEIHKTSVGYITLQPDRLTAPGATSNRWPVSRLEARPR